MLVDYPQAVVAGGQNEGLPQLAERTQRAQVIEVGGSLFGFDLGGSSLAVQEPAQPSEGSGEQPLARLPIGLQKASVGCLRLPKRLLDAARRQISLRRTAVSRERALWGAGSIETPRQPGLLAGSESGGQVALRARRATGRSARRHEGRAGGRRGIERGQKSGGGAGVRSAPSGDCRGQNRGSRDLLPEADFGFGGMNVDVHLFGRHLEKQQHHRRAGGRNDVPISLSDCMQQQAIADKTLVDEDVD